MEWVHDRGAEYYTIPDFPNYEINRWNDCQYFIWDKEEDNRPSWSVYEYGSEFLALEDFYSYENQTITN